MNCLIFYTFMTWLGLPGQSSAYLPGHFFPDTRIPRPTLRRPNFNRDPTIRIPILGPHPQVVEESVDDPSDWDTPRLDNRQQHLAGISEGILNNFRGRGCDKRIRILNGATRVRDRGTIVRFQCSYGFHMLGASVAVCVQGKWSEPPPICVRDGCRSLPIPTNGALRLLYGGAVGIFTCNYGYKLEGERILTCDGLRWNGSAPICAEMPPITVTPPSITVVPTTLAQATSETVTTVSTTNEPITTEAILTTEVIQTIEAIQTTEAVQTTEAIRTESILIDTTSTTTEEIQITERLIPTEGTTEPDPTSTEAIVNNINQHSDKIDPNSETELELTTISVITGNEHVNTDPTVPNFGSPTLNSTTIAPTSTIGNFSTETEQIEEEEITTPSTLVEPDTAPIETSPQPLDESITEKVEDVAPVVAESNYAEINETRFIKEVTSDAELVTPTTNSPEMANESDLCADAVEGNCLPDVTPTVMIGSPVTVTTLEEQEATTEMVQQNTMDSSTAGSIISDIVPIPSIPDEMSTIIYEESILTSTAAVAPPATPLPPFQPVTDLSNDKTGEFVAISPSKLDDTTGTHDHLTIGHLLFMAGTVLVSIGFICIVVGTLMYCWRRNKGIARPRRNDTDGRTLSFHEGVDELIWYDPNGGDGEGEHTRL